MFRDYIADEMPVTRDQQHCRNEQQCAERQDTGSIESHETSGPGQSSKPSDGVHAHFSQYDYADMVPLQHELLTKGLGGNHLRLVKGTSMGCMHSWCGVRPIPMRWMRWCRWHVCRWNLPDEIASGGG